MTKLTPGRQGELLERLENGETVLAIANDFGMSRQALCAYRKRDQDFAYVWQVAAVCGAKVRLGNLENDADRRAMKVWLEPNAVVQQALDTIGDAQMDLADAQNAERPI